METDHPKSNQKKSDKTQKAIIDIAKIFFAEKGFEGTSFRTLAAEANLNHAVISYHFGNKEKLWLVVVQNLFQEFLSDCGHVLQFEINQGTDNRKLFRDFVEIIVRFNAKKPHLLKIAFRESMSANPLIQQTSLILDQYIDMSKTVLGRFQAVGIMSNLSIEDFHFVFLSSLTNRFMLPFLSQRMNILEPDSEEIIQQHTDTIMKIFHPTDPTAPSQNP